MKFLIVFAIAISAVVAYESDATATAEIRSVSNEDGTYSYGYETSNGISAQQSGVGGVSAQGSARWTAPDGTPVEFSYVADENGYRAEGPFVPEVPPYVLKLVEYLRTHASPEPEFRKVPVAPSKPLPFKPNKRY